MYPFIDKNDIILYDNPHSNHNRSVVIRYLMKGTDSKEAVSKNKTIFFNKIHTTH